MKTSDFIGKTKLAIAACGALLIACMGLYMSIGQEGGQVALVGNYIAQRMHTGLANAPATQIALENTAKQSQFASNNSQSNLADEKENSLAVSRIPRVLFDISVQPIAQDISWMYGNLWLWLFVALALAGLYIIYLLYKKRRAAIIRKIKSGK